MLSIIIQAVENAERISRIYLSIEMDIMGYFLISLIAYDIWSIQKSLFLICQIKREPRSYMHIHTMAIYLIHQCYTVQSTFTGILIKFSPPLAFTQAQSLLRLELSLSQYF